MEIQHLHGSSDQRLMSRSAIFIGISSLLSCMAFFMFDVVADLARHASAGFSYGAYELTHLVFEVAAVAVLGLAVIILRAYLRVLRSEASRNRETLRMLRGNFDEVLKSKFEEWNLTEAERDVTLLIIRGLSISDIAAARKTAQSTVKAQSTSIFRKIGVSSKTELMSVIIDEFLHAQPKSA